MEATDTAPALPELETIPSTLRDLPATIDVHALTQGLMPIVRELVAAVDSTQAQLQGVRHETLKQYPVGTPGNEEAKHYLKGIADAAFIHRRAKAAADAFRKWEVEIISEYEKKLAGGAS